MSEAERIAEIKSRADAAFGGEWRGTDGYSDQVFSYNADGSFERHICDIRGYGYFTGKGSLGLSDEEASKFMQADVAFIAHSHQDIPWLVEQVERLEQENAALRAQEQNEPLTTEELIKLDVAYFVFKENGLEHLSGWRVRKYCKQTDAHEFYGTDATYVDSRQYNNGNAGIIAYAREPKHAPDERSEGK